MEDFLFTSVEIADKLCDESVRFNGRATWLGDEKENISGKWEIVNRNTGGDLYGGTAGIALFLTRLWSITREEKYRELAHQALLYSVDWIEKFRPPDSLYSGSAGIAAVLA